MTERDTSGKKIALLHLLSATGFAASLWHFRMRLPFDDTFISFRYAEHLAAGHGLVWNIGGPHTEGYTNFLFILLLAAARFVTSDLLTVAQLVGILSTIATGLLIHQIGRTVRGPLAGALAALLYFWTALTWVNAFSGMETSLFVMLVVLSIYFVANHSYRAAFVVAFLATLTRPEGALLAVIIAIALSLLQKDRKVFVDFVTWFILPGLIYLSWKYFYFGELLPNSFYVKVTGYSNVAMPGFQYVRLFVTSMLGLILFSLGLRRLREPALIVATVWSFALITFYIFVTPLEGLYDRFLWPAFATLCICAAAGQTDFALRFRPRMGGMLAIALVAGHLALTYLSPRTLQAFDAHEDVWDASMDKIVTELKMLPHADSLTLAYGDAGYIVYQLGIRHIDLVGLNDTRIAHAKSKADRAAIVALENPDILLLPARSSDSCLELVEDAYGLARTGQFIASAKVVAFPYTLILFLNSRGRFENELQDHIAQKVAAHEGILEALPCLK